ncbi:metal ABC transporter permease [Deltaproteobacteria bacterium TL4]
MNMIEALQYEFIQNALYAGVLTAILCGVVGTLVVVKRIVFIAGGVAHASYGGIGTALFFGWPVLPSTLGFAIFITALMAWITQTQKHRTDAVIGVLWAGGMALGIILTDLTPGYQGELIGYLFGSLLAVSSLEIYLMLGLVLGVAMIVIYFYRDFLSMAYDEEFARVRGVAVDFLYILILIVIAVSVVLAIRVVGLILVIALFTIPPLIVERYAASLKTMIAWSVVMNIGFTLLGLALSYQYNLSSGASIIMIAVGFYGLSLVFSYRQTGEKF